MFYNLLLYTRKPITFNQPIQGLIHSQMTYILMVLLQQRIFKWLEYYKLILVCGITHTKQKTIYQLEVGANSFCQLPQWLQIWISLLGCLELYRYLHYWVHQDHRINLRTAAHFLLLQRLYHAQRLLHMLQQPQPYDGQEDSPGFLQLLQLGVIPIQQIMKALVSDYCSAVYILSLSNLSIAPWARVSLIQQGNPAGSAPLLCYWASLKQNFIALIHQNIYHLMSHTCPLQ